VGRRTRRVIRVGDRLTVQVAKVDTFKKQVDFKLAPAASKGAKRTASPRRFGGREGRNGAKKIGVGREESPGGE
jgi:ribonuclease R